MRTRLTRLLIACLALVAASAAVAAPAADVTLRVDKIRFSGAIASGAANEYVSVVAQMCRASYSTAIAGATTQAGGAWQAIAERSSFDGFTPATYRARWGDRVSEPVTVRPRMPITVKRLRRGTYRVTVTALTATPKLPGRIVELQRLSKGRWVRVQRARLRVGPPEHTSTTYNATFAIRARDASFRAVVPARSAAPCYSSGQTKPWRT